MPGNSQFAVRRVIAGLVIGLCGVLWTVLAVAVAGHWALPYILGFTLPALGIGVTILAWSSAVSHLVRIASQQRFAEDEFLADELPSKACSCGRKLEATFRFCPQCGLRLAG